MIDTGQMTKSLPPVKVFVRRADTDLKRRRLADALSRILTRHRRKVKEADVVI